MDAWMLGEDPWFYWMCWEASKVGFQRFRNGSDCRFVPPSIKRLQHLATLRHDLGSYLTALFNLALFIILRNSWWHTINSNINHMQIFTCQAHTGFILALTINMRIIVACRQITVMLSQFSGTFSWISTTFLSSITLVSVFLQFKSLFLNI